MNKIFIDIKVSEESIIKKNYNCFDCMIDFGSDQGLKKHVIQKHHEISSKLENINYRFSCPVKGCRRNLQMNGEYFTSRKHLIQHYHKVHNLKEFSCDQCDKKFGTVSLLNTHMKQCGKIFTCHCNLNFNSSEAMLTHQKRKHPETKLNKKLKKKSLTLTREVSTTTSGLGLWNSTEKLSIPCDVKTNSVFTSTDQFILSTRSAATSPLTIIKHTSTSTSTTNEELKEESSNSSSSINKKIQVSWSGDFDDTINLFDSDAKMEFYSTETQTDFSENIFHNHNYTQTTFSDFYDFEKFDNQTQTNWNEMQ